MAVTKLNYVPGVSETITDEALDDTPVLNTWYPFSVDVWKLALADVVLSQSGTPVPTSAYELAEDTEYTAREATESGDTIYAAWRITNATYAGIATTVSAENYGSYVDNEAVRDKIAAVVSDVTELQGFPELEAEGTLSADVTITATGNIQFSGTGFSSGVYTISDDGWYDIRCTLTYKRGSTADTFPYISIYVNTTKYAYCAVTATNNNNPLSLSKLLNLSSGDKISIRVEPGGPSGGVKIDATPTAPTLTIVRVK